MVDVELAREQQEEDSSLVEPHYDASESNEQVRNTASHHQIALLLWQDHREETFGIGQRFRCIFFAVSDLHRNGSAKIPLSQRRR